MPYSIRKIKGGYAKVKKGSGKIVSRHKTKAKSKASIRAYYANRKR